MFIEPFVWHIQVGAYFQIIWLDVIQINELAHIAAAGNTKFTKMKYQMPIYTIQLDVRQIICQLRENII
ncbi:TPA: hypothetical protein DEG21_02825 [Patescibacteria group bacterium]|nr:hypothetical protein [Candidatus Gracilibacteria bacterium]HBY74805.1 hypothetical protein [Candidatus Gracilibacteria bacterium]